MHIRLDRDPPKVFRDVEAAEAAAREVIPADDDDWSYRIVVDPKGSGRAHVVIVDEDGYDVGKL